MEIQAIFVDDTSGFQPFWITRKQCLLWVPSGFQFLESSAVPPTSDFCSDNVELSNILKNKIKNI